MNTTMTTVNSYRLARKVALSVFLLSYGVASAVGINILREVGMLNSETWFATAIMVTTTALLLVMLLPATGRRMGWVRLSPSNSPAMRRAGSWGVA